MRILAVAVFIALWSLPPLVAGGAAQSVLVEVTAAEDGAPLGGVFLSLIDDDGRAIGSGLTNPAGRFTFAAPGAGRFRVEASLIGRQTRMSAPVTVAPGDPARVTLALRSHAIPLAEIRVEAGARCRLRPADASELQRVWDEARKAIAVQAWTEGQGLYDLEITTYERDLDAEGRRVERENRRGTRVVSRIPFASLPPEELMDGGFVRPLEDGGQIYYAPDADVLLSDLFLDTHCFRLTRSAERPGAIGLGFEPVGVGDRPDITGTFWLDEESAALQLIEFRYTAAQYEEAEGLAGGRVEFQALPDGGWMIERWSIHTPLLARRHGLARARDSGIRVMGVRETGGEVISVSTRGQGRVARAERGTLRGVVWDSTRSAPLAGAEVRLSGTSFTARTDSVGRFVLDDLPAGVYTATFTHARLDSLGVDVAGVEAEVARGRTAELTLAVPSRAVGLAIERSREAQPGGGSGTPAEVLGNRGVQGVQGHILQHDSRQPIRAAEVSLRSSAGVALATGTTDERGFFRLRVPLSGRYLLTARALGYGDVEGEVVEVEPDRLSVLEVRMAAEAFELEPIVVTAERRSFQLEMEGFYERERQGFGVFMRPELLEERNPSRVTDLFFGVGGTQVIEPAGGARGRMILFRGGRERGCFPMVYVDRLLVSTGGLLSAGAEPTAIDDVVYAPDVLAIEVFRSPAEIPSEFHGPNAGCGVVVLWTRRGGGG